MGKWTDVSTCDCFNRSVHSVLTCLLYLLVPCSSLYILVPSCVIPFVTCILVLNWKRFIIKSFNVLNPCYLHCSASTVVSILPILVPPFLTFLELVTTMSFFLSIPLVYMTKGTEEEIKVNSSVCKLPLLVYKVLCVWFTELGTRQLLHIAVSLLSLIAWNVWVLKASCFITLYILLLLLPS